MHGCANPWNPKTLRSAAGAHLKVPIKSNITWDVLHKFIPKHTQVTYIYRLMVASSSINETPSVYNILPRQSNFGKAGYRFEICH